MWLHMVGIILLVVLDQWTKYLTVIHIPLHEKMTVIPNVLSLTYYQNTGAAWNILEGQMVFFYIVTILVVSVLFYLLKRESGRNSLISWLLVLMIAGALGNFIDRLFHQYVIDMIQLEFIHFPIFNLADTFLTIGALGILVYSIYHDFIQGGNSDE